MSGYKPILEVRRYGDDDGMYSWAVFRLDRIPPIIKGISRQHAEHIKRICLKMVDLPETITPITNWIEYDEIITDAEIENQMLTVQEQ